MNIYVSNLPYSATEDELRQLFEQFGKVDSARIITDRDTGRSRGFAFVEMSEKAEGDAAINGLNGKDMNGRALTINEARPRPEGGGGGGGRGGAGGGFRGGRGGAGGGGGGGGGRDSRW